MQLPLEAPVTSRPSTDIASLSACRAIIIVHRPHQYDAFAVARHFELILHLAMFFTLCELVARSEKFRDAASTVLMP